jgi:hypothetical protein
MGATKRGSIWPATLWSATGKPAFTKSAFSRPPPVSGHSARAAQPSGHPFKNRGGSESKGATMVAISTVECGYTGGRRGARLGAFFGRCSRYSSTLVSEFSRIRALGRGADSVGVENAGVRDPDVWGTDYRILVVLSIQSGWVSPEAISSLVTISSPGAGYSPSTGATPKTGPSGGRVR